MDLILPRVSHGISKRMVYNSDFPSPDFISPNSLEFRVTSTGKEMKHIITYIENYSMKLLNEDFNDNFRHRAHRNTFMVLA